MEVGDLIRMTLRGLYGSVSLRNVFYYLVTAVTGAPTLLEAAEDVTTNILAGLLPITADGVLYETMEAQSLAAGAEFATYTIPDGGGDVAGEELPPFVVWSFRYNRASGLSRHGYKRFTGVPEASQDAGVAVAGVQAALASCSAQLENIVSVTGELGNATLEPRIVSFTVNGQPRETPVDFPISSVSYVAISSQTTRKFGRGI